MPNEVIRASNDVNTLNFSGFEAVDYDVFLALCVKLRNNANKRVFLPSDDLRRFVGYEGKDRKQFVHALVKTQTKLLGLSTIEYDEDGTIGFNVFDTFIVPHDGSGVHVLFGESARHLITDRDFQYIHAKWDEYKQMRTAYSRRLYLLLKQYRVKQKWFKGNRGGCMWQLDKWRKLMDIPDSYKMGNIDQKVLNPAKTDFVRAGVFKNLTIRKIANGKGKAITHIEFTFTAEPKDLFPELSERNETQPSKAEKIANLEMKIAEAKLQGKDATDLINLKSSIESVADWMYEKGIPDVPRVPKKDNEYVPDPDQTNFLDPEFDTEGKPIGKVRRLFNRIFGKFGG